MLNILGIDYGTKRIGLALGDEKERMAFPFGMIENKSKKYVFEKIREVCAKESIKKIIVGLPVSLKGERGGKKYDEVIKFVNDLKEACTEEDKEIITEDERFTTKMVESMQREMDGTKVASKDAVAAMLILQGYLDKSSS